MAGLIATGEAYKDLARGGLAEVARAEQAQKTFDRQMKSQEKQGLISNVLGGAGLGFSIGGGPGALIGGALGLAGSLIDVD